MSVWIRAALAAGVSFAAATGALVGAEQVIGGADEATVETVSAPVTATSGQAAPTPEADLPSPPAQPVPDPEAVRAELRAFVLEESQNPSVDAFVAACTTPEMFAELPEDNPLVLDARFNPDAPYSGQIYAGPNGQSMTGMRDPMIYIDIGFVNTDPRVNGGVNRWILPVSWSSLTVEDGAISPVFSWEAIAARSWYIDYAGARWASLEGGVYNTMSIPCADPQSGAATLEEIRDAALRAQ